MTENVMAENATAEREVHGPVDFVLIEYQAGQLTGRGAEAVLDLVDRDIIRLFDVIVVGKDDDGEIYGVDLAEEAAILGGYSDLAWARTGLLGDEDAREAASAMEPGTLAVLIVYENTWAIPFVTAAREAGGELIASARIPAPVVMMALEALETAGSDVPS